MDHWITTPQVTNIITIYHAHRELPRATLITTWLDDCRGVTEQAEWCNIVRTIRTQSEDESLTTSGDSRQHHRNRCCFVTDGRNKLLAAGHNHAYNFLRNCSSVNTWSWGWNYISYTTFIRNKKSVRRHFI